MAFVNPGFLVPITFTYNGSVDNLTDIVLGYIHQHCKIFWIDCIMHDADHTFDTTTLTLEYDEYASAAWGDDTQIDSFATGAGSGTQVTVQLDLDDLTNSLIKPDDPDTGARILLTASNVSTGADLGVTFIFWVVPLNLT